MSPALFDMSGHGFYIWASYGMCLLAISLELFLIKRRRQHAVLIARAQQAQSAPARVRVQTVQKL